MNTGRSAYGRHSSDSYSILIEAYEHGTRFLAHACAGALRAWNDLQPRNRRDNAWTIRRVLSVSNLLIVAWIVLLYWGERMVFTSSIEACDWNGWEAWVCCFMKGLAIIQKPKTDDLA